MNPRRATFPKRVLVAGITALLSGFAVIDDTEAQSRKQARPAPARSQPTARPAPARSAAPAPRATPRATPRAVGRPSYAPASRSAAPSIPRASSLGSMPPSYRAPASSRAVKSSRYAPSAPAQSVRPTYRATPTPRSATIRPSAPAPVRRVPAVPRASSASRGSTPSAGNIPIRKVERAPANAAPRGQAPVTTLPRAGKAGSLDRAGFSATRRAPSAADSSHSGRAVKRIRPVDRADLSPRASGADALPRVGATSMTPGATGRGPRPVSGDLPRRAAVERSGLLPPAERSPEYSGRRSFYPKTYDSRNADRADRFIGVGADGRDEGRPRHGHGNGHGQYRPCYDDDGHGHGHYGAYFGWGYRHHDDYTVVYYPYSYRYGYYPYYDPWYPFYGTYGAFSYPYPTTTYSETTIYNQPAVEPQYREPAYYDVPDVASSPVVPPDYVPREGEEPLEDPLPVEQFEDEQFEDEQSAAPQVPFDEGEIEAASDLGEAELAPATEGDAGREAAEGETAEGESALSETAEGETPVVQDDEPAVLVMGHEAFFRKQYDDASRYYFEAMMADSDDPLARLFYAMARFARGDFAESGVALRGVFRDAPDLITTPIDWRQFYADRESLAANITALQTHLEAEPARADARLLLAYVHFATGEPESAQRVLSQVELPQGDEMARALHGAVDGIVRRIQQAAPAEVARPAQELPIP